jgi:hypothetical protein
MSKSFTAAAGVATILVGLGAAFATTSARAAPIHVEMTTSNGVVPGTSISYSIGIVGDDGGPRNMRYVGPRHVVLEKRLSGVPIVRQPGDVDRYLQCARNDFSCRVRAQQHVGLDLVVDGRRRDGRHLELQPDRQS